MNPTLTPTSDSSNSLFQNSFENKIEKDITEPTAVVIDPEDLVTHSEDDKLSIKNSWAEFYALRTEDITPKTPEKPVQRLEITETRVEYQMTETPKYYQREEETHLDTKPTYVVDEQKGSGSWLEDAGFKFDSKSIFTKIFGIFGGIAKDTFKTISLVREISMDTFNLIAGRKEYKLIDPKKAEAEAKKKEKQKKKTANIRAFYDALKAQAASVVTVEAVRVETQEKENINKTIKLTNASYKGIKDTAGRLTVYAASMFEREQTEQEHQAKKIEKQQKMASTKGPDLSLDKAAEGGFLSSTGGQGAG